MTGIDNYRKSLLRALRLMATFQPFVEFTSSLGTLIVIYFGGRLALQGVLPVADLVAFFLYLESFYAPVRSLSGAWEAVQASLAGADRVAGLLAEPCEPQNLHGAARVAIPVAWRYCPGKREFRVHRRHSGPGRHQSGDPGAFLRGAGWARRVWASPPWSA